MKISIFVVIMSFVLIACSGHNFAPVVDGAKKYNDKSHHKNAKEQQAAVKVTTLSTVENNQGLMWESNTSVTSAKQKAHQRSGSESLEIVRTKMNNLQSDKEKSKDLLAESPQAEEQQSVTPANNSQVVEREKKIVSSGKENMNSSQVMSTTQEKQLSKGTMMVSTGMKPGPGGLIWPVKGKVIQRFSAGKDDNQGVDIVGEEGAPIVAAADGQVVYSGNGLPGYGKLLIVKHKNNLLTAYGDNRKLLVGEGEQVKAGQKIAEMGSNDNGQVMLHFEVRRAGKPENPLQYLPKR